MCVGDHLNRGEGIDIGIVYLHVPLDLVTGSAHLHI